MSRNISISKLTKEGNYSEIFSSLNSDVNKLCLTQDEIEKIVTEHAEMFLASMESSINIALFLFKLADQLFVTELAIGVNTERKHLWINRFDHEERFKPGERWDHDIYIEEVVYIVFPEGGDK